MRVERLNNKSGEEGGVVVVFDNNESQDVREGVGRLLQLLYENQQKGIKHAVSHVLETLFYDVLKKKTKIRENSTYQRALTDVMEIITEAREEFINPRGMRRDDV